MWMTSRCTFRTSDSPPALRTSLNLESHRARHEGASQTISVISRGERSMRFRKVNGSKIMTCSGLIAGRRRASTVTNWPR